MPSVIDRPGDTHVALGSACAERDVTQQRRNADFGAGFTYRDGARGGIGALAIEIEPTGPYFGMEYLFLIPGWDGGSRPGG